MPRVEIARKGSVAVVVAHPDDESIGFGALISRFPKCLMIHVTDGAPRNPHYWRNLGFTSKEQYAATRTRELDQALRIVGHTGPRSCLGVEDLRAVHEFVPIVRRLTQLFTAHRVETVYTHAFEGGHPDHDATAFAVHAAARLSKRAHPIKIVEAPFYCPGGDGQLIWQHLFPVWGCGEVVAVLHGREEEIKRRMYAAHQSQAEVLKYASLNVERFRHAPAYDFGKPPNKGLLSNIYLEAGISAERWTTLVKRANKALRI